MNKKKIIWALSIDSFIFIMETLVMLNTYFGTILAPGAKGGSGPLMFRFFTEDSNIVLGLSSLCMAICLIRSLKSGKEIPLWASAFKFMGTIGVETTFLVVLFYLMPLTAAAYGSFFAMWCFPNMFFTHLVMPLLAFFSFAFLETEPAFDKKLSFLSLIEVSLYAILVGTFASLHLFGVDNVYQFMDVTQHPWWFTVLVFLGIFLGTYFAGFFTLKLRAKINSKRLPAEGSQK